MTPSHSLQHEEGCLEVKYHIGNPTGNASPLP